MTTVTKMEMSMIGESSVNSPGPANRTERTNAIAKDAALMSISTRFSMVLSKLTLPDVGIIISPSPEFFGDLSPPYAYTYAEAYLRIILYDNTFPASCQ